MPRVPRDDHGNPVVNRNLPNQGTIEPRTDPTRRRISSNSVEGLRRRQADQACDGTYALESSPGVDGGKAVGNGAGQGSAGFSEAVCCDGKAPWIALRKQREGSDMMFMRLHQAGDDDIAVEKRCRSRQGRRLRTASSAASASENLILRLLPAGKTSNSPRRTKGPTA